MLNGIWRDLKLAARSLVKARAFTFVGVITLGIGMAPVIAVPYGARVMLMEPQGIHTETLVEVVTTYQQSRDATSLWSYPDFTDLRNANTGATLVGWATSNVEVVLDPSQGGKRLVDGL